MRDVSALLEDFDKITGSPYTEEDVISAFENKLSSFGIDSVSVDYSSCNIDGSTLVGFSDEESSIDVLFSYNEIDGDWEAVVLDPSTETHDITVHLSNLDPGTLEGSYSTFLDLVDLKWMNVSTLKSILAAGSISDLPLSEEYTLNVDTDIFEATKISVSSDGTVRRIPIIKKRKRLLTPAMKAGFRRAALKRAKDPDMKKKRAKALAIRARLHLNRKH